MANILAFNITHDSSVSYLEDGVLKFFCKEERLSGVKRDSHPFKSLELFKSLGHDPDHVLYLTPSDNEPDIFHTYERYIKKCFDKDLENYSDLTHHACHASLAFYNSGYDEALVAVIDRNGSIFFMNNNPVARESESIYIGNRTKKLLYPAYKNFYLDTTESFKSSIEKRIRDFYCDCDVYARSPYGITTVYEAATTLIGQNPLENGKTMGLSSYYDTLPPGKPVKYRDPRYPTEHFDKLFYDGFADSKFFVKDLQHTNPEYSDLGTCFFEEEKNITRTVTKENYPYYAKKAKHVQTETQKASLNLIRKYSERTGIKNVCIVGGYGLNVVANNYYLRNLPDLNFYFEPCADDTGISLGAAMMKETDLTGKCPPKMEDNFYHYYDPEKDVLPDLHRGFDADNQVDAQVANIRTSNIDDICNLLINQKSVAIFQGCPESGPRALGHRSILFDSRNIDAKNIVNRIKNREWYRPFAGIILQEDFEEYFYTEGLKKSEYMTVSFDAKDGVKDMFPGIIHVDNTCRIQTVSEGFLYELLKRFKSKTECPVLLNTSFNLAGKPLVHTRGNAIETFYNTNGCLDHLYFVDDEVLYDRSWEM